MVYYFYIIAGTSKGKYSLFERLQASMEFYVYRRCCRSFKCEIVNIASDDTRELRAFVEKVYRITGSKGNLEYGTFQQAKEGALSIIPDVQKLHNITCGWKEKYSFEMGIRETLKKEQKTDNEKNQCIGSML